MINQKWAIKNIYEQYQSENKIKTRKHPTDSKTVSFVISLCISKALLIYFITEKSTILTSIPV